MPTYEITDPSGKVFEITAPEGATQEEVLAYAKQNMGGTAPQESKPAAAENKRVILDIPPHPSSAAPFRPFGEGPSGAATVGMGSVLNAAQGPLFGFGDELYGAASTLGGGDYATNRDRYRATVAEHEKQFPVSSTVGKVSASVLGGVPAARALPATLGKYASSLPLWARAPESLAQNLGNAAVTGAVSGSLTGAGEADGDNVGRNAMAGGMAGILLGPTIIGGAGAAAGGIRRLGAIASPKIANSLAEEQVLKNIIRDYKGSIPGNPNIAPDPAGGYTLGRGLLDDQPQAIANQALNKAEGRFGLLGDRAVLADVGAGPGKNTMGLLDTVVTMGGQTRNTVPTLQRSRAATRPDVLRQSAEDNLSPGAPRLDSWLAEREAAQKAAADPLYSVINGTQVPMTNRLRMNLEAMAKVGAFKPAVKMGAADSGVRGPGADFGIDLENLSSGPIKMADLDRVKQGMDDLISKSLDDFGNPTPLTRSYQGLQKNYLETLDKLTIDPATGKSAYGEARAAFAGPAQEMDAARAGRKAMFADDASLRDLTKDMSPEQLAAFRVGGLESLRDKLGTQGGITEVMNMWQNPRMAEKLREIFPDQKGFRQFALDVAKENKLKAINSVGTGAQTAGRQAAMDDLNGEAMAGALDTARGLAFPSPGAAITGMKNLWGKVATPEPVRDQIGRLLLGGPETIDQLRALVARQYANPGRGSFSAGLLAPNIGGGLLGN